MYHSLPKQEISILNFVSITVYFYIFLVYGYSILICTLIKIKTFLYTLFDYFLFFSRNILAKVASQEQHQQQTHL